MLSGECGHESSRNKSRGVEMEKEIPAMKVFIKGLDGDTFAVESSQHTVVEVMQRIEEIEGVPMSLQRLIFEGKDLEPGHTLAYYKIRHESTLHLTMELKGGSIARCQKFLAMWHLLNKQICRKCYGRLSPAAKRCPKAKCGRTTDIRPKKTFNPGDMKHWTKKKTYETYTKALYKNINMW